MSEKVKAKIAALLNMRVEKGATEDEAATAMRMAAALAAKYGIDLNTAVAPGTSKPKMGAKFQSEKMTMTQVYVVMAAAQLFGVKAYIFNQGRRGFELVGREELVEATEETVFWLFRQIEAIYKQHLPKGLSKRARAEFRNTFKPACAYRIHERAVETMKNYDNLASASGHNALVVVDYYKKLEEEIRNFNRERWALTPEQKQAAEDRKARQEAWRRENPEAARALDREQKKWARQAARRKGPRDRNMPVGSGTNAGYAAGDHVKLRKEVE